MTEEFKIEIRPIDSVIPYDKNPRINDKAVDAVAASLQEFGFRQPIVVDRTGVIVAGHTRYLSAKKLGLTKVPVHVATDLTPEQVKAYRIADNKTGEIAEWDFNILPIELSELQDSGFDMSVLGFSEKELTKLLETDLRQGLRKTNSASSKQVKDWSGRQRWVTFGALRTAGQVAHSEKLETVIWGPKMISGSLRARPYMGPAFERELPKLPPNWRDSVK